MDPEKSLEEALAADLREVADKLERNDLEGIREILLRNLPAYAFRHLGSWVGAAITQILS